MKKIFTILLSCFFIGMVNAQTWTIYTCDVMPDQATPVWATSDSGEPATVYTVETVDALSVIHGLGDATNTSGKGSWKIDETTSGVAKSDALTVMFRTKTGGSRTDGIEFEVNTNSGRLKIFLEDDNGRVKLQDDAGTSIYVSTTVNTWHTYRITMNGTAWKAFMDEDATPIASGSSNQSTQSRVVKFGDGGSNDTDGYLDWIAWDTSGEFEPGTTVPTGVVVDGVSTSINRIDFNGTVVKTELYNLGGVYVGDEQNSLNTGIYIQKQTFSNGVSKVSKIQVIK
nr:hypothetical protein [uncultured Carboxylicivirga sp.]